MEAPPPWSFRPDVFNEGPKGPGKEVMARACRRLSEYSMDMCTFSRSRTLGNALTLGDVV